MTRPGNRIVTETLRLDACGSEDRIRIPYSPLASWKSIGDVVLVKIKALPRAGMVQIKFRSAWGRTPTVQKADIDGSIMVERFRPAVEADGPEAGEPARQTVVHEGVTYEAMTGVDAKQALDQALRERGAMVAAAAPGMGLVALLESMGIDAGTSGYLPAFQMSEADVVLPQATRDMLAMLLTRCP